MDARAFQKHIGPVLRRIASMLTRGLVKGSNASGRMQSLQIELYADELKSDVEHFENYGFTARPLDGAEALGAFLGGDRSNGIVIAVADRRYRVTGLQKGEVCIYTDEGDKIHLKRGNAIDVTTHTLTINASTKVAINTPLLEVTASTKVQLTTPQVDVSAALNVAGLLTATAGVAISGGSGAQVTGPINQTGGDFTTNGDVIASGTHLHTHTHGGVQTGSGSTSGPN